MIGSFRSGGFVRVRGSVTDGLGCGVQAGDTIGFLELFPEEQGKI